MATWLPLSLPAAQRHADSQGDSQVESHLAALRLELDERARDALGAINGIDRRLLAARAYLRSEARLADRWSWTKSQIEAYAGSTEQLRLDAAVATVRCEFERTNAGYTLYVNTQVRSLERQLASWNDNESVGDAAAHMLARVEASVAAADFPAVGTAAGRAAFRRLLITHSPAPTPSLAAPGLSAHGRMRAVDFQVWRNGRVVAGADAATVGAVWASGGWTTQLAAAVARADVGFVGPLRSPDEPWHYELESPDASPRPSVSQQALTSMPAAAKARAAAPCGRCLQTQRPRRPALHGCDG